MKKNKKKLLTLSDGSRGELDDLWLDPWMKDVTGASELLKPYDPRLMRCYPVSSRINRVANDEEECSQRVEVLKCRIGCSPSESDQSAARIQGYGEWFMPNP